MPRIKNIKNFIVNASGSATSFMQDTKVAFQPDEAIVRQISYSGPVAQEAGNFLVWSSLINDYIGSFQVNNYGATSNPNIHIMIHSMLPNTLEFRIDTVLSNGTTVPYLGLTGDFTMHIDFIKY